MRSTKINLYFKLDRRSTKKQAPIRAIVSYWANGKREKLNYATGLTCGKKNFIKQLVHAREPQAELKNTILNKIRMVFHDVYLESVASGLLPDKDDFKQKADFRIKNLERQKNILDHMEDYIDNLKVKRKSKSFIGNMKILKGLLEDIKKVYPVDFNTINQNFETHFRKILVEKNFSVNTISSYIKRLKIFMNWAHRNNLHQNLIYKQFEMEEEAREIVALSEVEIQRIASLNIPTYRNIKHGGTALSRDWFIISTQTGVRFSDFKKIMNAPLIPVDGGFDISIGTQKTKTPVVIPVSKLLFDVLKRYDFRVPPPPSNPKYNKALKDIAERAGISKKITSHTGRKTFCTNMYLKGVPVPFIMKISGHKSERVFYKYIGVSLTENAALVRNSVSDFKIEVPMKIAN